MRGIHRVFICLCVVAAVRCGQEAPVAAKKENTEWQKKIAARDAEHEKQAKDAAAAAEKAQADSLVANQKQHEEELFAARKEQAAFDKSPAGKLKKKHPDWSDRVCSAAVKRQAFVGMTAEQLRYSWGKPERINYTDNALGRTEQWVYGSSYVYVSGGEVTAMQGQK